MSFSVTCLHVRLALLWLQKVWSRWTEYLAANFKNRKQLVTGLDEWRLFKVMSKSCNDSEASSPSSLHIFPLQQSGFHLKLHYRSLCLNNLSRSLSLLCSFPCACPTACYWSRSLLLYKSTTTCFLVASAHCCCFTGHFHCSVKKERNVLLIGSSNHESCLEL